MLGGGAGTTRDCFELIHQAQKYGARVALFGRKINLAESPLDIVRPSPYFSSIIAVITARPSGYRGDGT